MITILEDISQTGNKDTEVFIMKTPDERFIISIPKIHWSTELVMSCDLDSQFDHIQSSLIFHMYEGDPSILAKNITQHTSHYDDNLLF